MKKPLSLNTQLAKLRIVNNLLKQTVSEAICINRNGFRDTSRCEELKQVIYSLRDIQYMLRGLDYTAHRSAQTRKMTIFEIRDYFESIIKSKAEVYNYCGKLYKSNIYKAYIELGSVQQFLVLKGYVEEPLDSQTTAKQEIDTENDELF